MGVRSSLTPSKRTESAHLALPVKLFILSVFLPVAFQIGPLFLNGARLVLLAVSVPLFIQLLSGRFGKLIATDYLFLGHVLWMILALTINNPDRVIQQVGSVGMEFYGGYLLGRAYIQNRAQFLSLVKLISWILVLMLPLTLLEAQTGRPLIVETIRNLPGITSFDSVYSGKRLGLERVQGTFAHPIHFGLFCSMMVPVCYFGFQESMSRGQRFFLTFSVFLSAFMGLSAGVLLALVAHVILISWYLVLRNVPYKWVILTGLFTLMYVVIDIISTRDPIRVFMTYATFSSHTAYWRAIIFDWGLMNIFGSVENNIPPAPFWGIGLNDWIRPPFMHSGSMDNFWLVMGVRYGAPGALLLIAGYLWALWRIGKRTDINDDKELLDIRRGWMFVFVCLALTLATVHIWTTLYAYVFFFFGAGMWLMTAEVSREDEMNRAAQTPDRIYSRFPVTPRSGLNSAEL